MRAALALYLGLLEPEVDPESGAAWLDLALEPGELPDYAPEWARLFRRLMAPG